MKKTFTIGFDHGKGGTAVRVFADDISEVRRVFCVSGWEIYSDEDTPTHLKNSRLLESDINEQEPWLRKLVYRFQRQLEGKERFPVMGKCLGQKYFRNLWARDVEEVRKYFPSIKFQYYVPWDPETPDSDIDIEDEFTKRFRVENT